MYIHMTHIYTCVCTYMSLACVCMCVREYIYTRLTHTHMCAHMQGMKTAAAFTVAFYALYYTVHCVLG
jgi:uncharacterized membrane protein YjfL (UPF0719 family)